MAYVRYKTAPTSLYNVHGEKKKFWTQEEVDQAWREGWFGPKDLHSKEDPPKMKGKKERAGDDDDLLSGMEWTKGQLVLAVRKDPRYSGFKVNSRKSKTSIRMALLEFEEKHGLRDFLENK
jgi:hypothetical protein